MTRWVRPYWLQLGRRRTGFDVRFAYGRVVVGVRWRRVPGAARGPFLYTDRGLSVNVSTLWRLWLKGWAANVPTKGDQ